VKIHGRNYSVICSGNKVYFPLQLTLKKQQFKQVSLYQKSSMTNKTNSYRKLAKGGVIKAVEKHFL
jgi:hypothetical protein